MLYLVSGTLDRREFLTLPHEELVDWVRTVIVPSAAILKQLRAEGKLLAGGVRAGTPDLLFVLDLAADSHLAVRRLLMQLPMFAHWRWEVTALESFEEWSQLLGG